MNLTPPYLSRIVDGNNADAKTVAVRIMNKTKPSPAQLDDVARVFEQHKLALRTSIVGLVVKDFMLADGSRVRIVSNSGQHTVMVWPAGGSPPELALLPLWIMVNVKYIVGNPTTWGGGGAVDQSQESIVTSYLYRVPETLDLSKAELKYTGSTESIINQTVGARVEIASTITGSDGDHGCLTAFSPFGKEAVLYFEESTQSEMDGGPGTGGRSWDHKSTVVYKDFVQEHEFAVNFEVISGVTTVDTVEGELCMVRGGPIVLAENMAFFWTRTVSGTYTSHDFGTFTFLAGEDPVYKRLDMAAEPPNIEPDPAPVTPASYTSRPTPYTRKEIFGHAQSAKAVYVTPQFGSFQDKAYDRRINAILKSVTFAENTIFYADGLVIEPLPPNASSKLRAALKTMDGKMVKELDLTDLPGLSDNVLYSAYADDLDESIVFDTFIGTSQYSHTPETRFIPSFATGYFSRNENNTILYRKSGTPDPAGRVEVYATFITDQKALWELP